MFNQYRADSVRWWGVLKLCHNHIPLWRNSTKHMPNHTLNHSDSHVSSDQTLAATTPDTLPASSEPALAEHGKIY